MKTYVKTSVSFNYENIEFFYKRERNTINGCPRYKVWISDPESNVVYETIVKGYEPIKKLVIEFLEGKCK